MQAGAVKQYVVQLRELPSLPEVAARVLHTVDDPRASAADLGRAMSLDPALTARLLRLANSALYGYSGRIGTVVQAVTVLGFAQVRSLVLTMSVLAMFSAARGRRIIPYQEFWEHSIACAVTARVLARRTRGCPPEEAFVAGLLHDLGKMILAMTAVEDYAEILGLAMREQRTIVEVEQEMMGFTHATVGGWAVEKWQLPDLLCEAVELHHRTADGAWLAGLAGCVAAADIIVGGEEYGWTGNGCREEVTPAMLDSLNLDTASFEDLAGGVAQECARARELLDVAGIG